MMTTVTEETVTDETADETANDETATPEVKTRKRRVLTPEELEVKAQLRDVNAAIVEAPILVEAPPAPIGRAVGGSTKHDKFRETLQANTGHWARMLVLADRESGSTRASMIRNSKAKWEGHTWDAVVSDSKEFPGKFELWVSHVAVGEPVKAPKAATAPVEGNGKGGAVPAVTADPFQV
jgi:hypothetical protein